MDGQRGQLSEQLTPLVEELAGRYRLERELGAGSMATVYLAHDVRHDRHVALKVLRDEVAASLGPERFLQEIRTTARLQHPHILPLLDSGEAGGRLFYVMPYVEGETLRARLDRDGALPLGDVVRLASQLAAGLESAHRRGVVHRDIKPENILLAEGLPLLADFGIALAVEHAGADRMTLVGVSLGTPAYMSPEQVLAEREIDGRSDQYSLACIVYEAVAGRPPFHGASSLATMAQHVTAPIPPLTSPAGAVPAALADAVRRALAKEPAERFATAGEFAGALVAALDAARPAPAARPGDEQSMVVLPFDNLSPDPGDAYLADGLTEELTADLARVRSLRVTARSSAVAAKERTRDVREIARLLGVRHVLEGSVRRVGNALRITAQLIDGETDAHLWSDKYAGTMDDVFAMQERISRTIVDALAVRLSSEERRGLAARPIADLSVYEVYLQVRHHFLHVTVESLVQARRLLDETVALAPGNAVLAGAQALLEIYAFSMGLDPSAATLQRADAHATRALALDPRSAEALFARAIVAEKSDLAQSVEYLRQSVAAAPITDAMTALAFALALRGEEEEALRHARRAVQLDPLSPLTLSWGAVAAWYAGDAAQAVAWIEAALHTAPESPALHWFGSFVMAATGRTEEALAIGARGLASNEGIIPVFCGLVVQALGGGPMPALPDEVQGALHIDPHGSQFLAELYAAGGARDEALHWLGNAIRLGVVNARYMAERSPFLASLRADAAFEALVAGARVHGGH